MLHKESIKGETFELLKTLMRDERLSDFKLAGGTSLALYLGHRKSIDFDLFTEKSFDAGSIEKHLIETYDFKSDFLERNTIKGSINDIKVDCITHNYPFVESPLTTKDGIRIYGIKDIAAMKLSAIADDGTRLKDFIDIACLSTKLSLSDMLNAYQQKYKNSNPIRALKGLTFFEDVNFNEPIQMIQGKYNWDKIEMRLHIMIKKESDVFPSFPLE
ncbi:MAG: nucleotidyl transferase AbiEii/AbiGii toxin family protein [Bacteroidales bacterium]|nr:nucleotidyl transferase AbiEii/AbiGii toxin family protein [Bacteroidales bacterium]